MLKDKKYLHEHKKLIKLKGRGCLLVATGYISISAQAYLSTSNALSMIRSFSVKALPLVYPSCRVCIECIP